MTFSAYFRLSIFLTVREGGGGYVNSESNDGDVSACPWHTDAWSGSTYEQSVQVLALWDHFCGFQEIDDLQYLKFSIFRHPGTVKISCFQKIPQQRRCWALKCRYSIKWMYFTSFTKELNVIRSYVKELQTTKCRFSHKKAVF